MTQPTGQDQQDTPPSFIPSGSRRRAAHASPVRADTHAASRTGGSAEPPSFSPAADGRAHGRARTAGSSSASAAVAAPVSAAPNSAAPAPVSFAPSAGMAQDSGMPGAERPREFRPQPHRTPSRERARTVSRPAGATPIQQQSARPRRSPSATAVRRHRPLRVTMIALLAVVALIATGAFSAWGWVNGQLVRQNMLTAAANTPAQTWLLLGSDERDASDGTGINDPTDGFRTDTILVLTKPQHGNASLISIPRDSLVEVNGRKMKINAAAAAGGYPALVGQVEAITGMNVDHVAVIHFGGLKNVVDALGGVELCYDRTVNDVKSGLNWQAGCHTADGSTALAFSRMRYSDPKGDFGRAERQRQVISAITKKAASRDTLMNFGKVTSLIQAGLGSIVVDEHASPWSLLQMAFAFKDASGDRGVTGTVYWTDADYRGAGVGSSVLLDSKRNTELFTQLAKGTHDSGTVGSL